MGDHLFFYIVKVNRIAASFITKLAIDKDAAIIFNDFTKRVVDRLLNQNRVIWACKGLDGCSKTIDDAAAHCHPFRFDVVPVVAGKPAIQGFVVVRVRVGITKDSVIDTGVKISEDILWESKIHISNPHGKKVRTAFSGKTKIIFEAACSVSVHQFVKGAVGSHCASFFPTNYV